MFGSKKIFFFPSRFKELDLVCVVFFAGCAIVMCKAEKLAKDVFEDLPLPRRQDVCLSLFHCLNWLRELVSPASLVWLVSGRK